MIFRQNYNLTPLDMYNGLSRVYLYQTRRNNPLVYKGLITLYLEYEKTRRFKINKIYRKRIISIKPFQPYNIGMSHCQHKDLKMNKAF